ncbi:maker620, partial [Drosophila busckii]
MFKDLVKYETKIKQLEGIIKNLNANSGASGKCDAPSGITQEKLQKLQDKLREQETEIRTLKATTNEQQLAKDSLLNVQNQNKSADNVVTNGTITEDTQKEILKLQNKIHDQELVIQADKLKYNELYTRLFSMKDECKIKQMNLTINNIQNKFEDTLKKCEERAMINQQANFQLQSKIHKHEFEYKELLKNLSLVKNEYESKIQEQNLTINNLQNKFENTLNKNEQLQDKLHRQDLSNKAQETKFKSELNSHNLMQYQLHAKILEQDLTINNLQNEVKDTLKRSEQLQDKLHRQDLSNKAQEIKFQNQHANQLLTNNQYQRPTIIRNFGNLYTYINEPTNCVAYGNDIQTIRVPGTDAFQVPCDSKFAGPGWAVIQRRVDGSVNFNRTWEEYRNGFGDLRGEFWLGLEKLHLMTKFQPHELYIQLENFKNEHRYAHYRSIAIRNRDNDKSDRNCATDYGCGWWFNDCVDFNPNGIYVKTKTDEVQDRSIKWVLYHEKPLKFVQMMIRPTK